MGPEIVTIAAGGSRWTAFMSVEVHASFKDAVRTFSFNAAAEPGASATAWTFKAGTPIEIFFNDDLAVSGYVDRYQPKIEGHSDASITVSGRGRGQDFCDCSAMHETGEFLNKTPLDIGQSLDKFGVGIASDIQLDKIPIARITPGETAFRCLEKLCRSQGVFLVGQADGSIKITQGGTKRHAGGVIEGVNLLGGSADHNWSNRHSKITVRGQRAFDHGDDNLQIEQSAEDADVGRERPLVLVQDGDIDKPRAQKRAQFRRDREAGNSIKAEVRVQGFRDDGGTLWEPGNLIWLESPFLDIAQDMAVDSVKFEESRAGGSVSHLTLVDPRAIGGKSAKGGKASGAWGTGAGADD